MSSRSENLVGIDLGTTVSVIARLDPNGTAAAIPNSAGDPLTPSVVYLDGSTALVGKIARDATANDPGNAAMFVKRDMGSSRYSRQVQGRYVRPETLSAIILRKLKLDAEKKIGPINKAVITVPAFFDDTRRKATEDAGRIAGLQVLDIINEPTAAALAYAMQSNPTEIGTQRHFEVPGGEMTAVVYDLGGGTFDVTVVKLRANRFESQATGGEVRLGGKDWDDKIADFIAMQFQDQFGIDPMKDLGACDSLGLLAEQTKIVLSQLKKRRLSFSFRDHTLTCELTREQFEEMTAPLLTQTELAIEKVVSKEANLSWDMVDRILLVGGSTRMPAVKDMLRKVTGQDPDDSLDPDQVVAQGAAIHAAITAAKAGDAELELPDDLQEQFQNVEEFNINSHSLGVLAARNGKPVNSVMIKKNTQLPVAASRVFPLRYAGSTEIPVKVLEGEAQEAEYCSCIGTCAVTNLPAGLPKGAPVQVRLSYDAKGRVSVMALDMTHGRFAKTNIEHETGLTEEAIQRETRFVQSLEIP